MTTAELLAEIWTAARDSTPAGRDLADAYAQLHAAVHIPAYLRRGQLDTVELMARCKRLEDLADAQTRRALSPVLGLA